MFEESLLRTVAGFLARSERLALQPFEERAAGGRDIGEPPGRAGGIERRDRPRRRTTEQRYELPASHCPMPPVLPTEG